MTKKEAIKIFEEKKVRTVWDDEQEKWFFSIVDVVCILVDSPDYQTARNYWKVLNAKDCGVPQNRERVFMVSILGEHPEYIFPEKQELKLRLKDFVDDVAEEKYYINKIFFSILKYFK